MVKSKADVGKWRLGKAVSRLVSKSPNADFSWNQNADLKTMLQFLSILTDIFC